MVRKKIIMQLALATLIVMPLIAIIIDHFSDEVSLSVSLTGVQAWWLQLTLGIVTGLVIAIIAQWIISTPMMEKVNARYANMLGRFHLTVSEIAFVSVCAGVGEEILFRGAIQPILGVVFTAFIFVAIHGYISPRNWRLSIYGFYMTVAMIGIGILAERSGLIAAIISHAVIDIYLLFMLQRSAGSVPISENPELAEDLDEYTDKD